MVPFHGKLILPKIQPLTNFCWKIYNRIEEIFELIWRKGLKQEKSFFKRLFIFSLLLFMMWNKSFFNSINKHSDIFRFLKGRSKPSEIPPTYFLITSVGGSSKSKEKMDISTRWLLLIWIIIFVILYKK